MAQLEADKYFEEIKEAFEEGHRAATRHLNVKVSFEVFIKTKIEQRLQNEKSKDVNKT